MADPLSIATSIATLIELTKELVKFGYDFYKAREGREEDNIKLKSLESLVDLVATRLEEARLEPTYPWHKVILDKLDANRNVNSLTRLAKVIDALKNELRPGQKIRKRERWLHHWKKEEIKDQFAEISECWGHVESVLDQGHYELSKEQHRIQKAQYGLQKDQHERVEKMEGKFDTLNNTLSRQEEERTQRRLKKEEESLRKAVEQWLSPLEFFARQRDLISKCYPTGLWLLESEEFTSWVEGRPWQLRCHGDTGCGKVSCRFSDICD